eukprot:TRINITY_DN11764_c0_g1_i1.p1 TRINITY_DN11764_c0_g1~~TRINITY_DN11764_c0_g1_i1.p1  ORF type:complete len:158 (+),score=10.15 TRINITY_DN11764_c0_g1_i1:1459-1932(+)
MSAAKFKRRNYQSKSETLEIRKVIACSSVGIVYYGSATWPNSSGMASSYSGSPTWVTNSSVTVALSDKHWEDPLMFYLRSLTNELHVSQFSFNFVSISTFIKTHNCSITFLPSHCDFQDLWTRHIIGCGCENNHHYTLKDIQKRPTILGCKYTIKKS